MKITIVSIGKWKNSPEAKIFAEYQKRMKWKIELIEVDEKNAANILDYVPEKSYRVVLDEKGKHLTSRELANQIDRLQSNGNSHISILIGAAGGHNIDTLENADLLLSLGKMTWPHMLVRAMLAEQLYRAFSILSGHPYHRD